MRTALLICVMMWFGLNLSAATVNLSGDWEGPNGLMLTIKHNPQTRTLTVEYCGIYRLTDWDVKATLADSNLTFTGFGDDGARINGLFTVVSSDVMNGKLNMITDDSSYNFDGRTSLVKSGFLTAEARLLSMGGATYIYQGKDDGLELYFAPVATHRVDGSMLAQDEVELSGYYEINGYEVSVCLDNAYVGSNGQLIGTFSQDMNTLTIHNYSDSPYLPSTISMKLKN